ncbi:MAG: tRNA pseudouridine(38-40) synthase TruA [Alphaproteobacteria bacterium]
MPRYKITLEYDGKNYAGWQRQPDRPSIQQALEESAYKFSGENVEVLGAGRTDAGVHATAQVAHLDFSKEHDPYRVMQGLNFHLFGQQTSDDPVLNQIAVTGCEQVPDDFNARFSATRRHYLYRIINRRARLALEAGRAWHVVESLDLKAMQAAAKQLIGNHDFTSFRDTECQAMSPVKTLDMLDVQRVQDNVIVRCHARSFLHHQVRIMVGSLVLVGKGRWSPDDIKSALEARDRTAAGPTAPADGLFLVQVDY